MVSLVERQSKLTLLAKVERNTEAAVKKALVDKLKPLANRVHTITSDNGREFAAHEAIAEALGAEFYFAHPYHSWERGLNENTNGLVRQYFPKGSDFITLTDQQVQAVLNHPDDWIIQRQTYKAWGYTVVAAYPVSDVRKRLFASFSALAGGILVLLGAILWLQHTLLKRMVAANALPWATCAMA